MVALILILAVVAGTVAIRQVLLLLVCGRASAAAGQRGRQAGAAAAQRGPQPQRCACCQPWRLCVPRKGEVLATVIDKGCYTRPVNTCVNNRRGWRVGCSSGTVGGG